MGFFFYLMAFPPPPARGVISAAAPSKISHRCLPSAQGLGCCDWANVRLMLISPTLAAGGAVAASQIGAEVILTLCHLLRCVFKLYSCCGGHVFYLFNVLFLFQFVCSRTRARNERKYFLKELN